MSFNMQQPYGTDWDSRKDNSAALFNNEDCDIVGTQEAVNYMRDYIISNTTGYAYYGTERDGVDEGEACYIFYKSAKYDIDEANSGNVWLSTTPTTPSKYGGDYNRMFTYVRLIEKSSGTGFYLFNIHNYKAGEYDYRVDAVKLLTQKIADRAIDDPVFITGDFNSSENDNVTVWMQSGADNPVQCYNSYREFDPTGIVVTRHGNKTDYIDYIFYPRVDNYSTSNSYVANTPVASDHYPIIATVAYTKPTTHAVPCKIEAENYDLGGNGIGYYDLDAGNQGGVYRADDVDIQACTDTGEGYNIGWFEQGEWLQYTIDVATTDLYDIAFRTASETNAVAYIEINQVKIGESFQINNSGAWQIWQTTTLEDISLEAGEHRLRLVLESGGFNLNYMEILNASLSTSNLTKQVKAATRYNWTLSNNELILHNTEHETFLYRLYTTKGQSFFSGTITDTPVKLNTSSLPKGIYFLKLGDSTHKLIKP